MNDLRKAAADLEIASAARDFRAHLRVHLAKKPNPMAEQYIKRLPSNLQKAVLSMPEKDMDKNEAYNNRKVLALAKKLKGMPHKALMGVYKRLHKAFLDCSSDFRDIAEADRDNWRHILWQLESAWRASNEALQTVGDERKERDKKNEGMGKYMPRAELKKRRKIEYKLVEELAGWDSPKSTDPIFKVITQAKKDGYYVRINLLEKALKHIEALVSDPAHADETNELKAIHRGLNEALNGRHQ